MSTSAVEGAFAPVTITMPDVSATKLRAAELVAAAQSHVVTDADSHGAALALLADLKAQERKFEDELAEPTKRAHETHKWFTTFRKTLCDPLARAAEALKPRISEYERKAREEAARKEREAREAAERIERERREADERRAAEEKRKADEAAAQAQRAVEEARKAGDADGAELAALEAADAEETARRAALEQAAIKAEPIAPPAVVKVAPALASVAGVSTRTTWRAEVTDLLALVKYVAEHPEWLSLLKADETALNGIARSQKNRMQIPGVKAVEESGFSVRRTA